MRFQQGTDRPDGFFCGPNGIAPMIDAIQTIQRTDAGQQGEFFALELSHAPGKIFCRSKRAIFCPGFDQRLPHLLAQAFDIQQTQAQRTLAIAAMLNRA